MHFLTGLMKKNDIRILRNFDKRNLAREQIVYLLHFVCMLNLTDILSYYPPVFQTRQKHVLREYLQYEILEYIFRHAYASKLVFIG